MVTGWALYLAPPDKMFRQIVYNVHIFKFYSRDICYEVLIEIHSYIMIMHTCIRIPRVMYSNVYVTTIWLKYRSLHYRTALCMYRSVFQSD